MVEPKDWEGQVVARNFTDAVNQPTTLGMGRDPNLLYLSENSTMPRSIMMMKVSDAILII